MDKSTFSPLYQVVREQLVRMRRSGGLTQRQLAKRLGREHSFVARIEQGERRLDVVEFYWVAKACGASPGDALREVVRRMKSVENAKSRRPGGQARPERRRR